MKKIDLKQLSDLAAHTFTNLVILFMLLAVGYSLAKPFTSDEVPAFLFVSLELLFIGTFIDMIMLAFNLLEEKVNAFERNKKQATS